MPISPEARSELMRLARASLAHTVANGPAPKVESPQGVLAEKRGCFVTLTNRGALRGCIGTFAPQWPLAQAVVRMAAAACRDGRFVYYRPVTAEELPQLTVEVSVLSQLEPIADPLSLEVGKHGIYVVRGANSGCFLPEVATDQGWDAEQFLSHCCAGKANLAPDAWRDDKTQVYVFTSEKFTD
ncbi:MAG: AmmeMemoRadiSam system protein A [Planctomycetes bacterium]|nr:AmmeMemoRadiSam system protein A [Planctomycetota bacterium]